MIKLKEIWKDINGYEGLYQISNFGNVKSLKRKITKNNGITYIKKGRNMTLTRDTDGYYNVKLSKNGVRKSIRVHRLVAINFIPNPNNLNTVNHKDLNRKNNHFSNLEWLDWYDNLLYSVKKGRYKTYGAKNSRSIPIMLLDNNKKLIKNFDCIEHCSIYIKEREQLDTKIPSIRDSIRKKLKNNRIYLNKYYFKKCNKN